VRSVLRVLIACCAVYLTASTAQAGIFERIFGERIAPVQDGAYIAADRVKFALQKAGKNFLLRLEGDPETYVLQNKALIVTFNPERGYFGLASSRSVASQLGALLGGTREASAH
jgi:hypothetical protein